MGVTNGVVSGVASMAASGGESWICLAELSKFAPAAAETKPAVVKQRPIYLVSVLSHL